MKHLLIAACLLACAAIAGAQDLSPFVIPSDSADWPFAAALRGGPIDVASPRLLARDGHFYAGDKRVRIWGVNLCFGANFPTHEDAQRVARRLSAFGVNSVRFHHMDGGAYPSGIWDPKDPLKLSEEALERLDYFVDCLARNGIYANINLHVSRSHSAALKLPDAQKLPHMDKMADIFTPQLIDAQRKYARDLLAHVSAYRKVRYADDPAVAFVEINNEDSLFMWGAEQSLPNLPPYYLDILHGRYAAWLKSAYGDTDKLRAAWAVGAQPLGKNLLTNGDFATWDKARGAPRNWQMENHEGCASVAAPLTDVPEAMRIDIRKADATAWHIQINQPGLTFQKGQYYTARFRARADQPRAVAVSAGQAHGSYGNLGLHRDAQLTAQWQEFTYGFESTGSDANGRVCVSVGGSPIAVDLADFQFCPGGREGLRSGESLEKTVAVFADQETPARAMDRMKFLAQTEKAFFDGMYAFIKKDLDCKALVTGTIVFGPLGLYGQSDMDYIDGHAYWHHPEFPGRPWDPANWLVQQAAMTDQPDRSPLMGLAAQRLAGKPYTVSEYNHPAPNDYQAECVPLAASFAAAQDWDGVWLFAYSHRTNDARRESFESFFDIDANPAKWGFMPAGAILMRQAAIGALKDGNIGQLSAAGDEAGLPRLASLQKLHGHSLLGCIDAGNASSLQWDKLMSCRLYVTLPRAGSGTLGPPLAAPGNDSGDDCIKNISWTPRRFFAAGAGGWAWAGRNKNAPADKAAAGPSPADPVRLAQPAFAAVTLTALDGKPLEKSSRLLLTACGRCENTGMVFSADRRTVGRNWGTAPVLIEPVDAEITLPKLAAGKWRCSALAPDGKTLSVKPIDASQPLEIRAEDKTMWRLLMKE